MVGVDRLLELWVELPYTSRALLLELAEALVGSHSPSSKKTVFVPRYEGKTPTVSASEQVHACPECRKPITDFNHQFCFECGCPLPTWRTS